MSFRTSLPTTNSERLLLCNIVQKNGNSINSKHSIEAFLNSCNTSKEFVTGVVGLRGIWCSHCTRTARKRKT
eukprot:12636170-Prorocentrum_lima.AAC.1